MAQGWFKSSASSGSAACVEVLFNADSVSIRDSKQWRGPFPSGGPIIVVPVPSWFDFLDRLIHGGAGDPSAELAVDLGQDGHVMVTGGDGLTLRYTNTEWIAFLRGVRSNEFSMLLGASA